MLSTLGTNIFQTEEVVYQGSDRPQPPAEDQMMVAEDMTGDRGSLLVKIMDIFIIMTLMLNKVKLIQSGETTTDFYELSPQSVFDTVLDLFFPYCTDNSPIEFWPFSVQ